MDTYKDAVELNDLWASGSAPWRLWADDGNGHRARSRTPDTGPVARL
jgi:hypothetical protein